MPLLDAWCPVCKAERFDILVKNTANPVFCECGGVMEKQLPLPHMHPKGRGTHRTDYDAPTRT